MAPDLPVDEKFSLWLDEEGDYIIECNRPHQFLAAHGATPNEAVEALREVLAMAAQV